MSIASPKNISLNPSNGSKSWDYKIDYNWTKQVVKSSKTIAKVAKYSLIGIALLSIVETITELVKLPLKFIGNQFGLYKYSLYKSKAKITQIDQKDNGRVKEEAKEENKKTKDDELIKKTPEVISKDGAKAKIEAKAEATKIENEVKPTGTKSKLKTWKKVFLIGLGILAVGASIYGGYRAYSSYNQNADQSVNTKSTLDGFLDLEVNKPKTCPIGSQNAKDDFVARFEKTKQCPTMNAFIQDQRNKGYWGWTLDNLKKLFGSDRDLTLQESRNNFYHKEIQQNIPSILASHPDFQGGSLEKLPKNVAKDISELRDTARDYTRQRSYEGVQRFLNRFEPRDKGFEYYWDKYKQNPEKVIVGSMRSNSFYDNPILLKTVDSFYAAKNWVSKNILTSENLKKLSIKAFLHHLGI